MNILLALLVLGIIVLIHEFGHFITAKLFKMPVQEFAIGMGPHIYSYQGKKTVYSLRSIPIGGFVSIEGMEVDSKVEDGFNSKPPLQRFIVLFAGVAMNFILAFVLIISLLMVNGKSIQNTNAVVGNIVKNSNSIDKLLPKDKIIEINGEKIMKWEEVSENITKISQTKEKDKPLKILVERQGKDLEIETMLTYNVENKKYYLGIIPEFLFEKYGFLEAVKESTNVFNKIILETLNGIQQLLTGKLKKEDMSGPIGIIKVVGEASQGGVEVLTWLTIMLSINIGIFNLLPFPALDGGRIIFVILELIGIKIDKKFEEKVHVVGMIILIGMIIYATGNDIMNIMEK